MSVNDTLILKLLPAAHHEEMRDIILFKQRRHFRACIWELSVPHVFINSLESLLALYGVRPQLPYC